MLCCIQVYVISRSRSKEELAHKMGAKGVIPSGDEEEMKKFAGKHKPCCAAWPVGSMPGHDVNPLAAEPRPGYLQWVTVLSCCSASPLAHVMHLFASS
jgi:hypothetical protein